MNWHQVATDCTSVPHSPIIKEAHFIKLNDLGFSFSRNLRLVSSSFPKKSKIYYYEKHTNLQHTLIKNVHTQI